MPCTSTAESNPKYKTQYCSGPYFILACALIAHAARIESGLPPKMKNAILLKSLFHFSLRVDFPRQAHRERNTTQNEKNTILRTITNRKLQSDRILIPPVPIGVAFATTV
jgi:hypothetical protein